MLSEVEGTSNSSFQESVIIKANTGFDMEPAYSEFLAYARTLNLDDLNLILAE